jgi:hypothetical protein
MNVFIRSTGYVLCIRDTCEILAQEIVKDYPDYDVIWNNCQKFVAYLLEAASPRCPLPTTLEALFFL